MFLSITFNGSVWNSEAGVLHGFSARIFCLFMPEDGLFSPGSDFLTSGQHVGLGMLWGQFWGSRKTYCCEEMILWWGYRGIPSAQMNSVVPGTHLGVLVRPKTSLSDYFVGISSFPGKLQVAPVPSLLSLVVPLAAYFPLVVTLGCRKRLP